MDKEKDQNLIKQDFTREALLFKARVIFAVFLFVIACIAGIVAIANV